MKPLRALVAVLLPVLLGACGGEMTARRGEPASPVAARPSSSIELPPARLDDRLVLVRWGAPLRTAPDETAAALRDEAWLARTELGAATPFRFVRVRDGFIEVETLPSGDDEQYCSSPSTGFRGLALRLFVKQTDLALVLTKSLSYRFAADGTSVMLERGIQVGPTDPRPAGAGHENHQVEFHGRRMIAPLLPHTLGWSYLAPEPPSRRASQTRRVREGSRPMVGKVVDLGYGNQPRRSLWIDEAQPAAADKILATIRLPCAEVHAVVANADVVTIGLLLSSSSEPEGPGTWVRGGAPVRWASGQPAGRVVEAVRLDTEVGPVGNARCFRRPLTIPWPQQPTASPTFDVCFEPSDLSIAATPPSPRPSAPAELAPAVIASVPATVLHTLLGLTGLNRAPFEGTKYRGLLAAGTEPEWLVLYREWLTEQPEATSVAAFGAHAACAFDAPDLAAFYACLPLVTSEPDRKIIAKAVAETDALLERHARLGQSRLNAHRPVLADLLAGSGSRALTDILTSRASLQAGEMRPLRVVLVPGASGNGQVVGRYVVIASSGDLQADARTALHEMAHLALFASPDLVATKRALLGRGNEGVVALNRLDEAFATSFDRGVAAPRLGIAGKAHGLWYDDVAIDAISRALHAEWQRDATIHAGTSLAAAMVSAVERSWPRERWTTYDLLSLCWIYAEDRSAATSFTTALFPALGHVVVPVPPSLGEQAAPEARVMLMTEADLVARPELFALFGTSLKEVRGQLAASPSAVHWSDDARGVPLVLVVARDREALVRGAGAFGARRALPGRGWTAIR